MSRERKQRQSCTSLLSLLALLLARGCSGLHLRAAATQPGSAMACLESQLPLFVALDKLLG